MAAWAGNSSGPLGQLPCKAEQFFSPPARSLSAVADKRVVTTLRRNLRCGFPPERAYTKQAMTYTGKRNLFSD